MSGNTEERQNTSSGSPLQFRTEISIGSNDRHQLSKWLHHLSCPFLGENGRRCGVHCCKGSVVNYKYQYMSPDSVFFQIKGTGGNDLNWLNAECRTLAVADTLPSSFVSFVFWNGREGAIGKGWPAMADYILMAVSEREGEPEKRNGKGCFGR